MKVVFYFSAEWCFPCKKTKPIVEQFVHDNENISVVFIDVDDNIDLAEELNIRHVPTLILFENEEEVHRTSSIQNIEQMKRFVYG